MSISHWCFSYRPDDRLRCQIRRADKCCLLPIGQPFRPMGTERRRLQLGHKYGVAPWPRHCLSLPLSVPRGRSHTTIFSLLLFLYSPPHPLHNSPLLRLMTPSWLVGRFESCASPQHCWRYYASGALEPTSSTLGLLVNGRQASLRISATRSRKTWLSAMASATIKCGYRICWTTNQLTRQCNSPIFGIFWTKRNATTICGSSSARCTPPSVWRKLAIDRSSSRADPCVASYAIIVCRECDASATNGRRLLAATNSQTRSATIFASRLENNSRKVS